MATATVETLETRMWEDGIDNKEGFFKKCLRIAAMINEDYHPQGSAEIVNDNLIIKRRPMEAMHIEFSLETLWNEYIGGLEWDYIEHMFEQKIDMI